MSKLRRPVSAVVARLKDLPGALLPVLHAIQEALGYVPAAAVPVIAEGLNLSRAEVHGVISFYHYFRDTPPGRHTIHMCRAEACQSMNQRALEAHAKRQLGVDFHGTTADGAFTFEPVYCLGNCACSPAIMIDGELYGRVTPERFDAILAQWEKRSVTRRRSTSRAMPRRCRSARKTSRRRSPTKPRARQIDVTIVRNGTRGMVWLEPLVEVALSNGRVGVRAGVTPATCRSLFDADFLNGGAAPAAASARSSRSRTSRSRSG